MNSKTKYQQALNPLILRCHRLMEAFAKSDDERDFYLDRAEGFLLYVDLDKPEEDLDRFEKEISQNADRYVAIPKMTFYETKKIMEGFVNEKVYDIDTKEKLLEIIQAKEARENFLEFIFDHHSELEKWQQYYLERSRIRIIEWLRQNNFEFVFEEDLDVPRDVMEKVKAQLFDAKASKEVLAARKILISKAKSYYSSEALNPRPKRGRPPKQVAKTEVEPQMTTDLYTTVSPSARPFLFMPDYTQGTLIIFSRKFENEDQLLSRKKLPTAGDFEVNIEQLSQKLSAIRSLSSRWKEEEKAVKENAFPGAIHRTDLSDEEENVVEEEELIEKKPVKEMAINNKKKEFPKKVLEAAPKKVLEAAPKKSIPSKKIEKVEPKKAPAKSTPPPKKIPVKKAPAKKPTPKKVAPKRKKA